MEQKAFQQYSDDEFRDALIATMNLKQEWMAGLPPVILVRITFASLTLLLRQPSYRYCCVRNPDTHFRYFSRKNANFAILSEIRTFLDVVKAYRPLIS